MVVWRGGGGEGGGGVVRLGEGGLVGIWVVLGWCFGSAGEVLGVRGKQRILQWRN